MVQFDVVALGELLIDFTLSRDSAQGNPLFEANPGGAPCNVLAMLTKLGRKCAFVGKVGDDMFGRQLRQTLNESGICADALITDAQAHTTLAFVKTAPNGDRDFSFYRDPGADMLLTEQELPKVLLSRTKIFHFGSLSMTHEGIRRATKAAVALAKAAGALISFDPNLRPPLWADLSEAREQIAYGLSVCDVLKIADNELQFMTGEDDPERGARRLQTAYPNIRLLNVTCGAQGSHTYCGALHAEQAAFLLGGTVDTTGAGDTFCACILHFLLTHTLDALTQDELRQMLRFANAAAYLVTTKKGALRSMPSTAQISALLQEQV